jgi:hypothetical protein
VLGVGLRMPLRQFVVAGRCQVAPYLGAPALAGDAEGPGEGGGVGRVVAGGREGPQAIDSGLEVAQGYVDLGQLTKRRSVGRHPPPTGAEPGKRGGQVALVIPHQAAPEVERRHGEGRGAMVALPRFGEQALCLGDVAALGVEHCQRAKRREAGPVHGGGPVQFLGLGVGPGRLQDHRPLGGQGGAVGSATLCRGVEVGQGVGEAVEGRPRPGPGQQSRPVTARPVAASLNTARPVTAYQSLGEFSCPLVVGDAAQDLPAQGEQVDQGEPVRRRSARRPQGARREPVDLRVQVDHGDRPAGGERLPVTIARRLTPHPENCPDTGGRANGGVSGGGLGLGSFR